MRDACFLVHDALAECVDSDSNFLQVCNPAPALEDKPSCLITGDWFQLVLAAIHEGFQVIIDRPQPIFDLTMSSRMAGTICAVLLAIIGVVPLTAAQGNPDSAEQPQATQAGVEGGGEVPGEEESPAEPLVIIMTVACDSEVNIIYEQRDTIARVEGSIGSSSCPASRGEYTAVVGLRDENGEIKSLEFVESWQRNDDLPISFINEYEIGTNVDLTRVRLRQLRCTCTGAQAE